MHELHRWTGDEPADPPTLPLLYNIVYCSRASGALDQAALQRIVATAHRYNPAHGITGMLVFGSGVFFQWLEGPREHVTALMDRLRADPRHDAIVELSEVEEVRERLFPLWDMELVTSEHIREVLDDALGSASDERNARALRSLLDRLDAGPLSRLHGE
jgi:hypothetical protein